MKNEAEAGADFIGGENISGVTKFGDYASWLQELTEDIDQLDPEAAFGVPLMVDSMPHHEDDHEVTSIWDLGYD